jgi:hypothetical protein
MMNLRLNSESYRISSVPENRSLIVRNTIHISDIHVIKLYDTYLKHFLSTELIYNKK